SPAVRPDGGITITYVNVFGSPQQFRIKYVRCTPAGAPVTPSCQPAVLVFNETHPLPFGFGVGTDLPIRGAGFPTLGAEQFPISTYPKHDHRVDANGTETYVMWDRCKVALIAFGVCPDADVVMRASKDNGATWAGLVNVVAGDHNDQFFPAIKTDRSRNIVNITYYSSQNDLTFQHRVQVFLNHINPGAATPDPINDTHVITSLLDDPSSDPFVGGGFFGDYIGVAARGSGIDGKSHAYVGFTYNDVGKNCGGVVCPQQDNKLQLLVY
ncbi:MAG TPA: hypothetical protein VKK81_02265, partial [Candidatus Binatia bacterium]|nr:hypothetical protein [Candidatus Binatia bacterium]